MGQEKVPAPPSLTDVAKASSNTTPAKPSKVYSIHGGGGKLSSTVSAPTGGGPVSAEGAAAAGVDTSRKATSGVGGDTNSTQVSRPTTTTRVNSRPIGSRR